MHLSTKHKWDLEHGGDDKGTVYPAHMAAYQGDLQVLQSLVSRGIAGVNDRDDTNCTPAHKAAGNGHVECVRWLMEMGADMSLLNAAGETPRDVARRYGQLGCASLLGSEPDEEPSEDAQMECDEQSQERALHRLEELTKLLEMAKTNYHQLGGLLEDEKRQKEQDTESARIIDDLTSQLQLERVRREKLEAQVDELKGELYSTRLTESSRTSLPLIHSRTTSAPRSAHSKQHQEEKPRGKKSVKGVTRQRLSAEPGVFLIRSSLSPETAVSRRQY
ncbi:ankyrin repeat domain-containing protein 42-like [Corticium candelabrum]|uniref:ankyrin repeat domain-containing protein 42-like n=1 Tax=Corticium candelabrum TaxID=121492 RepID=UPI002E25DA51|nr:ankyrin repeat domain-containing protein 42-like [Corticium candelabrum]